MLKIKGFAKPTQTKRDTDEERGGEKEEDSPEERGGGRDRGLEKIPKRVVLETEMGEWSSTILSLIGVTA